MKAFVSKKQKKAFSWRLFIPIVIFAVIVIAVLVGVQNVSVSSHKEQLRIAEQAVRRSVVQCYAIEGRYPPSLDYLEEHYGLVLETDAYVYHYQRQGTNLLPEIRVFAR